MAHVCVFIILSSFDKDGLDTSATVYAMTIDHLFLIAYTVTNTAYSDELDILKYLF